MCWVYKNVLFVTTRICWHTGLMQETRLLSSCRKKQQNLPSHPTLPASSPSTAVRTREMCHTKGPFSPCDRIKSVINLFVIDEVKNTCSLWHNAWALFLSPSRSFYLSLSFFLSVHHSVLCWRLKTRVMFL